MSTPLPDDLIPETTGGSGQATAKLAIEKLTAADASFAIPTQLQRRNIAMAFAGRDKIVYGKAFDAVRLVEGHSVDLDDRDSVEEHIDSIVLYEVKSTNRKNVMDSFDGYFFALTTAELLVAQSLGDQFKFLFVHTLTDERLELTLSELYAKTKSIYPSWSVRF